MDKNATNAGTGVVSTPPAAAAASVGEKVTIDKKDFELMMETIKSQGKQIGILFESADKSRLARAMAGSNGESLIKTVKVRRWPDNGKYIIGWKLVTNQSEIVNNRWIEKQDTTLMFDDGTSLSDVSLLDFYRKPTMEKAEVLKRLREEDEKGNEIQTYQVRFKDGKTINIGAAYIN